MGSLVLTFCPLRSNFLFPLPPMIMRLPSYRLAAFCAFFTNAAMCAGTP